MSIPDLQPPHAAPRRACVARRRPGAVPVAKNDPSARPRRNRAQSPRAARRHRRPRQSHRSESPVEEKRPRVFRSRSPICGKRPRCLRTTLNGTSPRRADPRRTSRRDPSPTPRAEDTSTTSSACRRAAAWSSNAPRLSRGVTGDLLQTAEHPVRHAHPSLGEEPRGREVEGNPGHFPCSSFQILPIPLISSAPQHPSPTRPSVRALPRGRLPS